MGSGASTPRDSLRPLLLSQELIDGSCKLAGDALFRTIFTQYLKSGVWMDCLARLVPDTRCHTVELLPKSEDVTACLREYNLDESRLTMLMSSMRNEKSITPLAGSPASSVNSRSFRSDGYVHPDNISSFTQEELLNVLFTILVPIYLSSPEYVRFAEYGMEEGGSPHDDSNKSQNTELVQTSQSKRAQELLLGSAAFYDESFLQDYLLERSWLDRVCPIFHDHPVPLCFTDTAKSGLPIVFANKAFCRMFGYAESELVGQRFSMLSGSDTEAPQLALMHSNLRSSETVKFAITLQSKSKKPLFDLVAQKAVGSYSISAHFAKSKHSRLETLNMVDDVLILLSYLLIVPALPVPKRPSWLPAPLAIMARSATNALHSSPSHARKFIASRSRSHSQDKTERTDQSTSRTARSYGLKSMLNSLSFSGSGSGSGKGNIAVRCEGCTANPSATSAGQHGAVNKEATVEFSIGEPTFPRSEMVG